jgi:hypothetical protein
MIQFCAGQEFMELLERVRSIVSHRLPPNATLEQVFTLVMAEYVKREDPRARHERREAQRNAARQLKAVQKQGDMENTRPVEKTPPAVKSPRWIPTHVRDRVHARDRGCCTYVGPGGRRCESTRHVQIDHIQPVARGGGATIDNLRLLCAQHNRLEADRLMARSRPPEG